MVITECAQGEKHQKSMKIKKIQGKERVKEQDRKGTRLDFSWKEWQMLQGTV